MQNVAPDNEHHNRVEWPHYLQQSSASLPASFIPLLACNTPPSARDVELVKQFRAPILEKISKCKREEEEIQSKIRELERELTAAKYSRRPLEKQVHACDVITSPFRRLPDDIIQEIIQHCPIYSDIGQCTTHFPLRLSQICRRWRRLVHGTSSLWKVIKVIWPRESDPMPLFNHCARLSRSRPLSLTLYEHTSEDTVADGGRDAEMFLQRLLLDVTTTRRLEGLEILAPRQRKVLDILKGEKWPLLKSYLLVPSGGGTTEEEEAEVDEPYILEAIHELLGNAPQLVQMCFVGDDLDIVPVQVQRPHEFSRWAQLTTLKISDLVYLTEWRPLMRVCTNLERVWVFLAVTALESVSPVNFSIQHVHQHLQELIIQYQTRGQHILLPFVGLRFPKLNTLQVELNQVNNAFFDRLQLPYSNFMDTLPSLETLIVGNTVNAGLECGFNGIVPLLQVVPAVKSLHISFSNEHSLDFLNFMQVPLEGDRLPLQNLCYLELEFLPSLSEPWPTELEDWLTNMLLETRRRRSSPPSLLSNNTQAADLAPVLKEMKVRLNDWGSQHQRDQNSKTRMCMMSYFWRLHYRMSMSSDAGIEVILPSADDDHDHEAVLSPLMKRFLASFECWKSWA